MLVLHDDHIHLPFIRQQQSLGYTLSPAAAVLAGMLEMRDDHWAQCVATPVLFWQTNRKPVS